MKWVYIVAYRQLAANVRCLYVINLANGYYLQLQTLEMLSKDINTLLT